MLEDLNKEVEDEFKQEEEDFQKFDKFCTTNTAAKKTAIADGQAKIESENSTILKKTADFEKTQGDIKEAKAKKEELEKAKEDSERQFQKDKAAFEATDADLSAAIIGLKEATAKLEAAAAVSAPAALLQFNFLDKTFDLAEAMGFLETDKRREVTAFLQQKADPWLEEEGAEHNKKAYEFQSGGIVQTLKDLEAEFSAELTKVKEEFGVTKQTADDFKKTTTKAIKDKEGEISNLEALAATTKGEADTAESNMLAALKTLKEDKRYLSELTNTCAARTADYTQRQKNREGEMAALGEATKVMKNTVVDLDRSVNGEMAEAPKGLIQLEDSLQPAADFLQMEAESVHHAAAEARRAVSEDQQMLSAEAQARARLNVALANKAVSMVAEAGTSLNSFRLTGLSVRMAAPDDAAGNTLGFVKDLVQDLINKLIQEAEAESTQKGFCDSEMGEAQTNRDRYNRESMKLNAKLKSLDTKRTELMEEISLLTDDIAKLNSELSDATNLRVTESEKNLKTIAESKEANIAVKAAMKTLNDFYAKANRMASKHDKKAEDVKAQEEIRKASISEGSYAGKQQQSLGIVTMMEVVRDDFKRTELDTQEEEDAAQEEFTKFKLASKEDIAGKETKKELCEEDQKTTENDLESKKAELTKTVASMDAALEALEELKPQCVDNVMSYEERVAKRDKEIKALETAMCTLDPDKKEKACKD